MAYRLSKPTVPYMLTIRVQKQQSQNRAPAPAIAVGRNFYTLGTDHPRAASPVKKMVLKRKQSCLLVLLLIGMQVLAFGYPPADSGAGQNAIGQPASNSVQQEAKCFWGSTR